ncbi:response regulator transcription factor [Saccharicrinis sp. 156]|uniref:response regulator transcription factor n=1 Tax=Saccharicrinis sp. 156 TaxID=3417574 RepID=UPI003D32FB41
MKSKILYVEDEPNLGKIVNDTLRLQGFEVQWETDGAFVMSYFDDFIPDVCVLDIMLPNIDGYQLCKKIRVKYPTLPIIFLTAKINTEDLVKGFEAGGTDYIRKPFSIEELIVRINNQINIHQQNKEGQENTSTKVHDEIAIGLYKYFPRRYELLAPSGTIRLSNREGELLQMMAGKGSQIIERKEILMNVWGDDSFFNSRNLDVYIKKLRNYFKEDSNIEIQTLRGKGYLFLVKR